MGIPGLIDAIGPGERISLAKLAITHLEKTAKPIRIAIDISIWLFQVQAGRGGRNPEIRTLFFRLLKFLSLPIHPLFVYDGPNKPPFKRGKAVSGRNAPIIQLSKRLVDLFRFPRHDAPGEAEAECANLQRTGIVDAVMSNDVDAMMFGSKMTIMNFSKESGGSGAASHVTSYRIGEQSETGLDREGMVLFAMLSGGDYLPSGVPKCGSKLAAEISKAGFGSDMLEAISAKGSERTEQLCEWRDRLQYELEENESGYFSTKHKAVKIPPNFPDQATLEYYASPAESSGEELRYLQHRLESAWDQDIDPSEIREFTAKYFDWNYRSGARKATRLLAEPLANYRLRLQKSPSAFPRNGPSLSNSEVPMMQKVLKTRAVYNTDGLPELQLEMIPVDVVGLDIFAEEPNPPIQSQSQSQETAADEEDDPEFPAEQAPESPVKKRVPKRYDPYAPEKIWIFETLANIGIPNVVEEWKKEQARKTAPKKPSSSRKAGPRKKGPIDPGMKRGSILKYGTLTKQSPDISQFKQARLFDEAVSSADKGGAPFTDLDSPSSQSPKHNMPSRRIANAGRYQLDNLDISVDTTSSQQTSLSFGEKRHPMATPNRPRERCAAALSEGIEVEAESPLGAPPSPLPLAWPSRIKMSYSNASYKDPTEVERKSKVKPMLLSPPPSIKKTRRCVQKEEQSASLTPRDTKALEDPIPSLPPPRDGMPGKPHYTEPILPRRRSARKKATLIEKSADHLPDSATKDQLKVTLSIDNTLPSLQLSSPERTDKAGKMTKQRARKNQGPSTPSPSPLPESYLGTTEVEVETSKQRAKRAPSLATHPRPSEFPEKPPKRPSKQKAQPRLHSSTETQPNREPSRHADSITIYNGFWAIDESTDNNSTNRSSPTSDAEMELSPRNHGRPKSSKKRIPRVSILDLT